MPGLLPTHPDFCVQVQGPARTVIIDFADLISRVLSNKAKFAKNGDDVSWAPQMAGHLISAISAGQWPQVRLAATRKWTDTTLCQLCMKETGTLLHRHCCSATKPANGWPQPPKEALAVADAVGSIRKKWLTTRGILLLKLQLPLITAEESFRWMLRPPDDTPLDATWFVDGSLFDESRRFGRSTGFAIAVISPQNALLACGHGTPPSWIVDAAGAELWAFIFVARLNYFFPPIVTDCKGILDTLQGSPQAAVAPSRRLAS